MYDVIFLKSKTSKHFFNQVATTVYQLWFLHIQLKYVTIEICSHSSSFLDQCHTSTNAPWPVESLLISSVTNPPENIKEIIVQRSSFSEAHADISQLIPDIPTTEFIHDDSPTCIFIMF